ncbi:efflux RND transporter periplasmic adaptor subunit [Thiocapsa rosea]|uniref:Membrane fusion protein (Multidrug efflux system) n=1 Tax=Thiocapsa rosea TaxID=69360 RepID=A0A495V0X2_9GAMM|nr:efflux RND transporter periplasmic adaptor subunit [Thiocapsa rosea]RKT42929.1 membrane fusion protein (multidrug efflux system) [Thiocapsa rosea]
MRTTHSKTSGRRAGSWLDATLPALTASVLTLTVGSTVLAADTPDGSAEKAPPPPAVVVAAVESKLVDHHGRFIGTIQAIQQVNVQARVEGFLDEVAFDQGSLVKSGQLLYQIEQPPFQAQLDAANAELASAVAETAKAQADLLDAQAQFERFSALVKKGDTSQSEFDRSRAQRDMAQANVDKAKAAELQAQAQIKTAQINLGYTTIASPIDGRIGATNYTVGNLVGPNSKVLSTVVQLDPIRAVFSIPSADFVRVTEKAGTPGENFADYVPELILPTGATYGETGTIAFVDNQVNASTGSIAIYADFPNPEGVLLPGQFITALIHTAEQKRQPVIPAGAVIQTKDGKQVYVVGSDNRVTLRTIKTGSQMGTDFVVDAGLKEGEIVVVSGIQKIKPGMVVTPTQAAAPKDAEGTKSEGTRDAPSGKTPPSEAADTKPETTEPENTEPAKPEPAKTDKDSADQTTPQTAPKTGS